MKRKLSLRWIALLLTLLTVVCLLTPALAKQKTITLYAQDYPVEEGGSYTSMEEVAVYLSLFEKLPDNFITKNEAEKLGWDNRKGNLSQVAPGCSIGGTYFGNYEKLLPTAKGRKWTECDVNYTGGYRGGERLVFSSDGLLYYSNDHYNSFTRIVIKEGGKK